MLLVNSVVDYCHVQSRTHDVTLASVASTGASGALPPGLITMEKHDG
jgi:hypothetical protein